MTEGILRFHLRSIGEQWARPMISAETIVELERERFIERSPDGTTIRLTNSGSRQKRASQESPTSAMNHSRTTAPAKTQRRGKRPQPPRRHLA